MEEEYRIQNEMTIPALLGIVMAIHTFGEYMDFHPHLHALVADGLFICACSASTIVVCSRHIG